MVISSQVYKCTGSSSRKIPIYRSIGSKLFYACGSRKDQVIVG